MMSSCNKFDFRSKQKMKKMIERSYEDGCEYFTIIKKDFALGEITKGAEGAVYPNELIESNKGNVIGLFHTHPYKKESLDEILKDSEKLLDDFAKKMKIPEDKKEKMKEILPQSVTNTSMKMSNDDLRYAVSRGFIIECIGTKDKEGKPRVFCYELYHDAKDRILKESNSLDENTKEIFKRIWTRWLNVEKSDDLVDDFLEAGVLLTMHEWVVKDKCEISL